MFRHKEKKYSDVRKVLAVKSEGMCSVRTIVKWHTRVEKYVRGGCDVGIKKTVRNKDL